MTVPQLPAGRPGRPTGCETGWLPARLRSLEQERFESGDPGVDQVQERLGDPVVNPVKASLGVVRRWVAAGRGGPAGVGGLEHGRAEARAHVAVAHDVLTRLVVDLSDHPGLATGVDRDHAKPLTHVVGEGAGTVPYLLAYAVLLALEFALSRVKGRDERHDLCGALPVGNRDGHGNRRTHGCSQSWGWAQQILAAAAP